MARVSKSTARLYGGLRGRHGAPESLEAVSRALGGEEVALQLPQVESVLVLDRRLGKASREAQHLGQVVDRRTGREVEIRLLRQRHSLARNLLGGLELAVEGEQLAADPPPADLGIEVVLH